MKTYGSFYIFFAQGLAKYKTTKLLTHSGCLSLLLKWKANWKTGEEAVSYGANLVYFINQLITIDYHSSTFCNKVSKILPIFK